MTVAEVADAFDVRPTTAEERRARLLRWVDLTRVLSIKNFRQRYLRSRLGIAWALLQPTLQAAVLTVVFVKIFHVRNIPHYPVFVLSGIMSWQFFQQGCVQSTVSIVENAGLVRKVAMPKVIFPLASVGGVLLVFLLQSVVLLVAGAISGTLGLGTFYLLLALPIETALIAAVGVLASSLHVSVRDIRFVIESGLLMAFYLTPVLYDISRVPVGARSVMEWNPMYGVLSLMRAAFVARPVDWHGVLSALVATVVIAVLARVMYRRRSAEFSDLV